MGKSDIHSNEELSRGFNIELDEEFDIQQDEKLIWESDIVFDQDYPRIQHILGRRSLHEN